MDGLSKRLASQATLKPNTSREINCPLCLMPMLSSRVARPATVCIDICEEHGIWFDAAELHRIARERRAIQGITPLPEAEPTGDGNGLLSQASHALVETLGSSLSDPPFNPAELLLSVFGSDD